MQGCARLEDTRKGFERFPPKLECAQRMHGLTIPNRHTFPEGDIHEAGDYSQFTLLQYCYSSSVLLDTHTRKTWASPTARLEVVAAAGG